ncbi:MAG TPA: hypothetical protein VFG13_11170 [Blastococcus sp.]|nr:hypothetical protein [Blastococcus sp.]
MNRIIGVLADPPVGAAVRVVCVRGDQVVAEGAVAAPDGRFAVEAVECDWVVVQAGSPWLAAAVVRPAPELRVELPDTARVTLRAADPPHGARLWLDPVRLRAFPAELETALRTHADGSVDLHVLDLPLTAGPVDLRLQPGVYRLGGGLLQVRPWDAAVALSAVVEPASGRELPVADGEAVLDIVDDTTLDLVLTR